MKDMQAILQILDAPYQQIGDISNGGTTPDALATVVKVEGSSYRRPGARMLVRTNGSRVGMVSGGCLEADVATRARDVMATHQSEYVYYDARTSNGDLVVELGCQGSIGIFIEPLSDVNSLPALQFIEVCIRQRTVGAMATVYVAEGNCVPNPGSRLMLDQDGQIAGTLAATPLAATLLPQMRRVIVDRCPLNLDLPFDEGSVHILVEPILPPISLLIFGAGQDAIPLCSMAQNLGWQVTLLDQRESMLSETCFPGARLVPLSGETSVPMFDTRTAAVIMNHSYEQDCIRLRHLLPSTLPYIGLLGPRKRAERMLAELKAEGISITAEHQARLYNPIGLSIGAETPEEVALSIIAEIQAVFAHRHGGSLRDKDTPIHP